jgi:hypothetical protein
MSELKEIILNVLVAVASVVVVYFFIVVGLSI